MNQANAGVTGPVLECRSVERRFGGLLRDAKLYEIGAGTSEIRRMLIGRELATRA